MTSAVGPHAVGPARVLLVCRANLCRSAMGEHLVRARARALGTPALAVRSAGVEAVPGTTMDPAAARELRTRGLDPDAFRTRVLTAGLIASADLVLVAGRGHRGAVVELDPSAVGRTFTVREMGRLVRALPPSTGAPGRLSDLVELVAALRGAHPPARPADDDLADPHRRGARAVTSCADLLVAASDPWLALLAGR